MQVSHSSKERSSSNLAVIFLEFQTFAMCIRILNVLDCSNKTCDIYKPEITLQTTDACT